MQDQSFTEWEILETHTDVRLAGDREIELQKEYGLPVDNSHYMSSIQNRPKWNDNTRHVFTKQDCINGGKWHAGKPKTGIYKTKEHTASALVASLRRIVCEYCGKDANTGNYSRWHGDNCKHKKRTTSL